MNETDKDATIARLQRELAEAQDKLENAGQAMSETQPSWEYRCHAIIAALGLDYGGPTPDIPEEHTWYSRNLKMANARADKAEAECDELIGAAYEAAGDLIHKIAMGYGAAGDGAIACGLYLTEGNVRALTPAEATAALATVRAEARKAGMLAAGQVKELEAAVASYQAILKQYGIDGSKGAKE